MACACRTQYRFRMRFEKTTFWTRSSQLADECYRLTSLLPPAETYGLSSQIRRAACSVYANFAEGWGRESKRDSAHFMTMARGSLSELKAHLLFCVMRRYFNEQDIGPLCEEIDELSRILNTVRLNLLRNAR